MTLSPVGRLRGLAACTSARGVFGVLALDHRQNLRQELRPTDPGGVSYDELVKFKREVVRALASSSTGVLLDPEFGAAQCIADRSLPGNVGLIVALEATGYGGESTQRSSRVLDGWGVAKAKRMGASAVKLLVYYHPDAPNAAAQERLVAEVAGASVEHDIPLILEPLGFSTDPGQPALIGEDRRRVVVATARRLTKLGGDVLKVEFPYDASVDDEARWRDACEELSEASQIPWVLLSGGEADGRFEARVEVACRAGASGIVAGRAVWGDAARLDPDARSRFLETTARSRLIRLVDLADRLARPWHAVESSITTAPPPAESWYRTYGS